MCPLCHWIFECFKIYFCTQHNAFKWSKKGFNFRYKCYHVLVIYVICFEFEPRNHVIFGVVDIDMRFTHLHLHHTIILTFVCHFPIEEEKKKTIECVKWMAALTIWNHFINIAIIIVIVIAASDFEFETRLKLSLITIRICSSRRHARTHTDTLQLQLCSPSSVVRCKFKPFFILVIFFR